MSTILNVKRSSPRFEYDAPKPGGSPEVGTAVRMGRRRWGQEIGGDETLLIDEDTCREQATE